MPSSLPQRENHPTRNISQISWIALRSSADMETTYPQQEKTTGINTQTHVLDHRQKIQAFLAQATHI
jgi:hypothetical protein